MTVTQMRKGGIRPPSLTLRRIESAEGNGRSVFIPHSALRVPHLMGVSALRADNVEDPAGRGAQKKDIDRTASSYRFQGDKGLING